MLIIKSTHNSLIKNIKDIADNYSKYPTEFCVEGIRTSSLFAISPNFILNRWFISEEIYNELPCFIKKTDTISVVTNDILKYISRSVSPAGIFGHFSINKNQTKKEIYSNPTFILYNLSDPGNVGAIIRTAVALGRKEIILIDGACPNSYKVIQSSVGTIAHIKIVKITWDNFIEKKKKKIPIYGLDMNGEILHSIPENELSLAFFLVGNEAHGISECIKKDIDRIISIPMQSPCESLNAAIAASIVGYKSWKFSYE